MYASKIVCMYLSECMYVCRCVLFGKEGEGGWELVNDAHGGNDWRREVCVVVVDLVWDERGMR